MVPYGKNWYWKNFAAFDQQLYDWLQKMRGGNEICNVKGITHTSSENREKPRPSKKMGGLYQNNDFKTFMLLFEKDFPEMAASRYEQYEDFFVKIFSEPEWWVRSWQQ